MLPMLLKAVRISLTDRTASRTLTVESADILLAWLAFSNAYLQFISMSYFENIE